MKASRYLIAGAAAALSITAMAQSPSPPPEKQGATFESLDTNSDGRISKTEAAADSNVTAQFSHYDQNGDGYIDRAEVTVANSPPANDPGQQ